MRWKRAGIKMSIKCHFWSNKAPCRNDDIQITKWKWTTSCRVGEAEGRGAPTHCERMCQSVQVSRKASWKRLSQRALWVNSHWREHRLSLCTDYTQRHPCRLVYFSQSPRATDGTKVQGTNSTFWKRAGVLDEETETPQGPATCWGSHRCWAARWICNLGLYECEARSRLIIKQN